MRKRIIIAILLIFQALNLTSQDLIQKATKTLEYRFEDCTSMLIQGEKATIRIRGKSQSVVELKILLVAKHKNPKIALNDLKHIRFVSEKDGTQLNLKNFYERANRKIESNLSVVYELTVPENIVFQLNNLYGSVTLMNLTGSKSVDISFGRIDMQNISGITNLQLKYTNLTAQNIAGKLTGDLSKSDAVITHCGATTDLNMKYGVLKATLTSDCEQIRVTGIRTEVNLQTPASDYNLDLKTIYSEVEVFDKVVTPTYRWNSKSSPKSIFVTTTYCPIKIKLK
ncbi:MAG: hypothetical protein Q7J05_06755 [Paludibacter sp.]|nr:hypothetical protein [Paludibacter sp.]